MKKPYVPQVEGNDQGRRDPDDWDAAGVAEEGKSGTKAIGWLMVSVALVCICAAVAYIVVDLVRMP